MSPRAALVCAFILAGVSLALALVYASVTPYRQPGLLFSVRQGGEPLRIPDVGAPDENRHANYVATLLERREIPVLRAGAADFDDAYQSHQPPLYYLLAAGWSAALGLDPRDPKDGVPLRALNAVIGAALTLGVFFAGRWGIGRDDVALGAAAIAGLLPMVCALNGAVSNDPLLFALMAWSLALLGLGMRLGWPLRVAAATGVVVGLAFLTKTSALALGPAVIAALWAGRAGWRAWLAALGVAGLLVAPWWVRNTLVYGDPLAMQAFNLAFAGQANAAAFIERTGAPTYWMQGVALLALQSIVGVFGYMDIGLDPRVYMAVFLAGGLCILGWAVALMRLSQEAPDAEEAARRRRFHWICAVLTLTVALLFVQFNSTYYQAQARYLFPALAPISLALALGAAKLFGRRADLSWAALAVALVGLDAYVLSTLPGEFKARTQPGAIGRVRIWNATTAAATCTLSDRPLPNIGM